MDKWNQFIKTKSLFYKQFKLSWEQREGLIYLMSEKKTITSGEHSLCFCNSSFLLMCAHNIYQRSSWWEAGQLTSIVYCSERKHSHKSFDEDMAYLDQFQNNKKKKVLTQNEDPAASMIAGLMLVLQFFITAFLLLYEQWVAFNKS